MLTKVFRKWGVIAIQAKAIVESDHRFTELISTLRPLLRPCELVLKGKDEQGVQVMEQS